MIGANYEEGEFFGTFRERFIKLCRIRTMIVCQAALRSEGSTAIFVNELNEMPSVWYKLRNGGHVLKEDVNCFGKVCYCLTYIRFNSRGISVGINQAWLGACDGVNEAPRDD